MKYSEIVEKIHKHEGLSITDVTGFQLIILLQNKEFETISYHGNIFEINFIPITYTFDAYLLDENKLNTFIEGEKVIEHWIHCYDVQKPIYVQIENEYFKVILDLLETAE